MILIHIAGLIAAIFIFGFLHSMSLSTWNKSEFCKVKNRWQYVFFSFNPGCDFEAWMREDI